MKNYQREFIRLALAHRVLSFGQFQLKSGRTSPYFFNAGHFYTGGALAALGRCYAQAIVEAGVEFDMFFGPAYKGIPLATATATALADHHGRDLPYAYDRKEAKNHGEGGRLVGAPLDGRVLIVDDVITAGTAVREVMQLIESAGARPAGVLLGLDRQERGQDNHSAIDEIREQYGVPVVSIITLDDIIGYLEQAGEQGTIVDEVKAYRARYGTAH